MAEIRIDVDFGSIANKCNKAVKKAQMWLDNEIVSDCQPYLPFLTGDLQRSTMSTVIGEGNIVYDVPYARKLYYGDQFNFNKQNHPLATAYWFEYAKTANEQKWINGVNKIVEDVI